MEIKRKTRTLAGLFQGNYYRTIQQENGNICIVKYSLYMKYRSEKLNQTLPPPELMSFFLDAVLFFVNAILLSGRFAKKINRQLEELRKITEKIAQNDLEQQKKEQLQENAAEHTDRARGMEVQLKLYVKDNQKYMQAAVHDYGRGFSKKDLAYADKEFYSGDTSRHNRNHQGLGLAIAKKFLEEQGGMLLFSNHAKAGVEVSCLVKISEV